MSAATPRIQTSNLDRLWGNDEPDLEIQDGEIRAIVPDEPRRPRGSALAAAGPVAAELLSSIQRWD